MKLVAVVNILVCAAVAFGQVPPGYELIQVTELAVRSRPDINNNSVVIWATRLSSTHAVIEVFKDGILQVWFDNGSFNSNPAINDSGDFVVKTGSRSSGPFGVALHKADGTIEVFDVDAVNTLDINNDAQIVWVEDFSGNGTQTEVFRFDGSNVQQLSMHGLQSQRPRINVHGSVVLYARDLDSAACFVQLFDGRLTILTDPNGLSNTPDINDNNQIVWTFPSGEIGQIILLDNNQETVLAQGTVGMPRMNNSGDVVYAMLNKQTRMADAVVRSADGPTYVLPGFGGSVNGLEINDRSEVAIAGVVSGQTATFMLRRTAPNGDFNHDCHRDAYDFAIFENCWTGADAGPGGGLLAGCNRADFDQDGDVDHDDFVAFEAVVAGPTDAVAGCVP